MSGCSVRLGEWQRLGPANDRALAGWNFGSNETVRQLAEDLTRLGRLEVLELARGLELRASSFVGRIQLGGLEVTIEPKLNGAPLLHLLRYAFRLRNLELHDTTRYDAREQTFQDLLIHQLAVEAENLMLTGLHREYQRVREELASPRGRIDFGQLAKTWNRVRTTLPCEYHPRSEDHPLNRALVAGLAEGAALTTDLELRGHLLRLVQILRETIAVKRLSPGLLRSARAQIDRRTRAYESALTIIEILLQGEGLSLDDNIARIQLPGFLFDMNRFFQQLVSRFLHDHLDGYMVEDEFTLNEMFAYDPYRNPQRRRSPVQRPDFLIRQNGWVVAILDAKYRDLWETTLPRDMLYQVALYALGRKGPERSAVILYATLNPSARDQAVFIQDPTTGASQAEIVIRPVNLVRLEALLRGKGMDSLRQKQQLACEWLFGQEHFEREWKAEETAQGQPLK